MAHHEDRRQKWGGIHLPKAPEESPSVVFTEKGNLILMLIGDKSFELTQHEFDKILKFAERRKKT